MKRLKPFGEFFIEDVPTNCASSGAVAGIGVGPQGELGGIAMMLKKLVRRKKKKTHTRK